MGTSTTSNPLQCGVRRIRIDADGESLSAVDTALRLTADRIEQALGMDCHLGECVATRNLDEPPGDTAYTGRLVIHPPVSDGLYVTA